MSRHWRASIIFALLAVAGPAHALRMDLDILGLQGTGQTLPVAGLTVGSAQTSRGTGEAASFDISLVFNGGLTPTQVAIFEQAEQTWESFIPQYQPGIDIASLSIVAEGVTIDGAGGVLGQAGPTYARSQGGFVMATQGIMQFDTADLLLLEQNDLLDDVIRHEMAHVIGFGSLWGYNGVYESGTGQYMSFNAHEAYQEEFDPAAVFVPVELDGGTGTADVHWDESWAGGPNELMTGFLDATPTFLSKTTVRSFADIGYLVAVPEPPTVLLLLIGVVSIALYVPRSGWKSVKT